MKIIENLWQVGGAEYTTVEDAAVYLVRFGEKAVLIDAGCGSAQEALSENIAEVLPSEVELIGNIHQPSPACPGSFIIF